MFLTWLKPKPATPRPPPRAMCSCAPRPTSPDLATSPRSRCTSHTYQISPYLPLTSARCAPRPTRTTFCSGSPRPADESGGEMRLRAAGPHFCACVRSFRGCALRGARHEAPSLRLLCAGYDKTAKKRTFACSPRPLPPWGPRRLAGVHIPSLPTGAVRAAASASPVSLRRLHSWRSAVWAIWADVLVRSEDGLVTTLLLIRRVHLPSEPRPLLEQPPAGASRAPANTRLACLR